MKRTYGFLFCLLLIFSAATAQQMEIPNHAFYKPMINNPAFTGSAEDINAMIISRSRWIDFKNAPQLNLFMLDGLLQNKKMALGLDLFSDKKGISNKTGGNIHYSYHLRLSENAVLRFGVALGLLDHALNYSNAVVEDPSDPFLEGTMQRKTSINGSAGLAFTWKKLEAGFSALQLLGSSLEYQDNIYGRSYFGLDRHYQGSLKYRFMISKGKQISVVPLAQLRFIPNGPLQYDANLNLDWKDKFWIGATYKSDYAVAVNAGVCIAKKISVGYSYDFIIGKIGKNAGISHELMINFKFGKSLTEPSLNNATAISVEKADSLEAELIAKENKIKKDQDRMAKLDEELSKVRTENETLKKATTSGDNGGPQTKTNTATDLNQTMENGVKISSPAINDFVYADNKPALKGFYVISGTFLNRDFAETELNRIKASGYQGAKIIYSPSTLYSYVVASFHNSKEAAISQIAKMKMEGAGDLWLISVK